VAAVAESGERELGRSWSAAVLSARPGEGATLVATAAAALIDAETGPKGQNVILMDADPATAGLSGLLRSWHATGTGDEYGAGPVAGDGGGLVGYALDRRVDLRDRSVQQRLQDLRSPDGRVGDMALLALNRPGLSALEGLAGLPQIMACAAKRLAELAGCLLVDCGPGWNARTRAVCESVDFVFVVGRAGDRTHPDTLRLAERLGEAGLLPKTIGHIANRPEYVENRHGPQSAGGPRTVGDTLPLRTIIDLPYDPRAAQTLARGSLSGPGSAFETALRRGMDALEPDLFRTGFDIY